MTPELWMPTARSAECFVSDRGRVARRVNVRHPKRPLRWLVYTPEIEKDGYQRVRFRAAKGLYVRMIVHRIVYETFVGDLLPGMVVCHDDGDKTNNTPANLRQDSQHGNIQDNFRHDAINHGARHGRSKLTEDQVREIRAAYAAGATPCALARDYGVNTKTLYALAVYGTTWRRVQ